MRMNFGKYKGREAHTLPTYYLKYALENFDLLPDTKTALEYALERMDWSPPPRRWRDYCPSELETLDKQLRRARGCGLEDLLERVLGFVAEGTFVAGEGS